MRFTKPFWNGIADGTITVAFRGWKRPTVVAGRPYRTGGGRIEVLSVDQIEPGSVTRADAKRAGYSSVDDLLSQVRTDEDRQLYRVCFRALNEPDPRSELANSADLDDAAVEQITAKLERLDNASNGGPWTRQALGLIDQHPGRRAPDLAEMVGRETKPFKLDVRKLKNLGLTTSLKIGYELSPRGRAYLDHTDLDQPRDRA
jgi:predicted transcriptional regulator